MSAEEELAERVLEALGQDDCEAFGELAGEEIEIHTVRGVRHGHEEAVAWARNKYEHLQRRFAAEQIRPIGPGEVLVTGHTEYVWKETGELADSTAIAIEMRFREGKLVRWRFREDPP